MIFMSRYAIPAEFRNVSNLGVEEYPDSQLNQLLDAATAIIDRNTGRTWQEVVTVTDELYDGNGQSFLYLNQVDIGSVTALSVDKDLNGSFTSVDTSDIIVYEEMGKVVLDVVRNSDIAVSRFIKGNETIKISYTYGSAEPTEDVKQLCIDIALNMINSTPELVTRINTETNRLKANSIDVV